MLSPFAKRLNQAIQDFYQNHGAAFSRTRRATWAEERLILKHIPANATIVDVGAGNGRFGDYVLRRHPNANSLRYVGIEPSPSLRAQASQNLALRAGRLPHLELVDQLSDVTVCLAVMHHLATFEQRQTAVHELIRITKHGGLIAASAWHLDPSDVRLSPIDEPKAEAGDHWMSWNAEGAVVQRYVHLMNAHEWQTLWQVDGIDIIKLGLFGRDDWTEMKTAARNWFVLAKRLAV